MMFEHNKSTRSSGRASNFRTNFIRSFVSDSAESSRFQIEEQILSEDADVDLVKLSQFAVKYQLPSNLRVSIWKLLLSVDSCYAEVKKVVAEHRRQEADILLKSLCVMRALSGGNPSNTNSNSDVNLKDIDILRMIQLGDGKPLMKPDCVNDVNSEALLAIAKHMLIACKQDWCDAFWLTKSFDELVGSVFTDAVLQKAAWETKEKLQDAAEKNVNKNVSVIHQNNLWSRIPFVFWFRSVGATMFSHEAVLKLWDKVCSCTKEALLALMKVTVETYICEVGNQIVQNFEDDKKDILEVKLTKDVEAALMTRIFDNFLSSGSSGRLTARR